jgi:subfamily B ATP-binding cassette protein MsbA
MRRKKHQDKYESGLYLLSRLFREHVAFETRSILIAIACMLIVASCTSVSAYLLKPVLDDIFLNKNERMLYLIPLAVVILSLIKGAASFVQFKTTKILGQKILTDIQLKLYSHLIYADLKYLTQFPSGNLISRFTNDINAMRKTVTDLITTIAVDFFTVIGLLTVMFYQSFELTCITLVGFPLAIYPLSKIGKKMRRFAKGIQEELADFTVRLDETFQNPKIIKSYCREGYEISRATKIINRFLDLYKRSALVEAITSPLMETIGGVAVGVVILYGGIQVISGQTTPGAFTSFIASILMIYRPVKSLSNINTSIQEGIHASKRLFTMLDAEPEIIEESAPLHTVFNSHNIKFSKVFFSYNEGTIILEDINIDIPTGKTVALVGSSGGGKSTLFNLLQRFYDPDYGEITIDGKNIKGMRFNDLRSNIALVSQEVALFDDTILENIRYGKLDATEEEILDASLAAAAHDFITNLPDGYNTHIGQHGIKLSGGQRQRIAIARAILKNAPILLLDEATSALDPISEKQVQMALEYLKKGRTTIVIAHRLSTIEKADLIYVVSDGEIKEKGSHQELLAKGGEYYELYNKYKNESPL